MLLFYNFELLKRSAKSVMVFIIMSNEQRILVYIVSKSYAYLSPANLTPSMIQKALI